MDHLNIYFRVYLWTSKRFYWFSNESYSMTHTYDSRILTHRSVLYVHVIFLVKPDCKAE